jgi:hypothetical protein
MGKKKRVKPNETAKQKRSGLHPAFLVLIIILAIFMFFPIIMKLDFFSYWDQEIWPFILIFFRNVLITGIWGFVCLLIGLVVAIGSTYMIITNKAFNPKGLILPATLLTVLFLSLAYGFFGGSIWVNYLSDAVTYVDQGADEKVIVLEGYEVDTDYGRFSAPTEYLYTSDKGETFTTQTIFEDDVVIGEEYKIKYLPKSKYLVGIERAD